jgi:hypothetical protein
MSASTGVYHPIAVNHQTNALTFNSEVPTAASIAADAALTSVFATIAGSVQLAGMQQATVATSQTTTQTASYADMATVGPAVTVTVGSSGSALVIVSCQMKNDAAVASYTSFALSGATTAVPSTAYGVSAATTGWTSGSRTSIRTGLTPGSTTFTMKYIVDSSTGTFANRTIIVIPL